MQDTLQQRPSIDLPSDDGVRAAFDTLARSETFKGSDRLIGFLKYVVAEQLEGRGHLIRAKSIAMDVYGYDPDEVEHRESVVRVDAGRVRRKLQEYYGTEGKDASVRLDLPKGGYVPVFAQVAEAPRPDPETPPARKKPGLALTLLAISAVLITASVLVWTAWERPQAPDVAVEQDTLETTRRTVLFDTSPDRLQAVTLAEQGRALIFPATDQTRLQAAMLVFESATSLDASYSGGYAGAAQVAGLMALTTSDPDRVSQLTQQARDYAQTSLELSPDSAWALSARAWAEFTAGNYDAALEWSKNAKELAPDDPNILEFDTLISLYSGLFEKVLLDTQKLGETQDDALSFVFQNARSAALFHLGAYESCIGSFEAAIANGAPLGPITVAYMMAAYNNLGDTRRAGDLAQKYNSTWPGQRVDLMSGRWYRDSRHSAQLIDAMRESGWRPH